MNTIYKSGQLELKAASGGPLTFAGYASVKNNIDLDMDMIVDGAYQDLDSFVIDGAVLAGHEKEALGVGIITLAKEDDRGLWVEGQFFETDDARSCHAKLTARMAAGKSCPMSFGFLLKSWAWITDANGNEYRQITGLSPKEASFVVVPANPLAGVATIKSITGMPPDEQLKSLLDGLLDWESRLSTFEKDRKQGLSDARIVQLKEVADKCLSLHDVCISRRKEAEAVLRDLQAAFEKIA